MRTTKPRVDGKHIDDVPFVQAEIVELPPDTKELVKVAEVLHEYKCPGCGEWNEAGWAHASCFKVTTPQLEDLRDLAEVVG